MNPFVEDASAPNFSSTPQPLRGEEDTQAPSISIDDVAKRLLKENFLLSALELHCELVEIGAELPRLRSFFSNPGNFERQTPFKPELAGQLPRSSSQVTLDSIDLTRFSEDGERVTDERMAVLEFELRKAQETIKSLRANLTGATELTTPDQGGDRPFGEEEEPIKPHERRALNFLINQYLLRQGYKLTSIAFSDENEDQDMEDWDDVGLNVAQPPGLLHFFREGGVARPASPAPAVTAAVPTCSAECQTEPDTEVLQENKALQQQLQQLQGQITALRKMGPVSSMPPVTDPPPADEFGVTESSAIPSHQHGASDTDARQPEDRRQSRVENPSRSADIATDGGDQFRRAVVTACMWTRDVTSDDRLEAEVRCLCDTADQAVLQMARCLPHVVPNVILAKRQELIPLLLTAIRLHPEWKQRDTLLNLLFNLIKRPDRQQRSIILAGLGVLAARLGAGQLEEEMLPQCWEQISHKYVERRLLVAETCSVLAPFIPPALRGSLVWSMLNQLVTDEKEEAVREAAVRSLAVVLVHCDDDDKFQQAWELTMRLLADRCESVQRSAAELLLPVLARWAGQLSLLTSRMVPDCLRAASSALRSQPVDWTLTVWLQTLSTLTRHLFLGVITSAPYLNKPAAVSDQPEQTLSIADGRLPDSAQPLDDLAVLHGDTTQLRHLVAKFDSYVSQEWYQNWPQLDWLTEQCMSELVTLTEKLPLTNLDAVYEMALVFRTLAQLCGAPITDAKLWPCCERRLRDVPAGLASALLPVTCAGLLSAPLPDWAGRLARTLQDALYLSSTCRLTAEPLSTTFHLLRDEPRHQQVLLDLIWQGVMHSVAEVRETTADLAAQLVDAVSDVTLSSRVLPALVTLASDPEPLVRRASVPALGAVLERRPAREVGEKVELQLSALSEDRQLSPLVVQTLGRAAAAGAQPDFCLSRLAEISRRAQPADCQPLLDAFTALSCCGHIQPATLQTHVLPGLRCLLDTLRSLGSSELDAAAALLRDFEQRVSAPAPPSQDELGSLQSLSAVPTVQQGMEEVRSRVNRILSSSALQTKSSQISGLFKKK